MTDILVEVLLFLRRFFLGNREDFFWEGALSIPERGFLGGGIVIAIRPSAQAYTVPQSSLSAIITAMSAKTVETNKPKIRDIAASY